jgi:type IX secretion system PorP/SprF family membrane protein
MKKITIISIAIILNANLLAQQVPFAENYALDKYSLSSAYAGNCKDKYLFVSYRRDWSGLSEGPRTFRVSYNDAFKSKIGIGGKIIYDKAGIFNQLFAMGTYSYKLQVNKDQFVFFGISAGIYRNTLNLGDYYNDPNYNLDPSLTDKNVDSKIKFMTDYSFVYSLYKIEAGLLFSNISFGDAKYSYSSVKYKPLSNYQLHVTYTYTFSENWDFTPTLIFRGGKYIKNQFEIATQALFQKKFWGSFLFRDNSVWGLGFGAIIYKSVLFNYSYNLNTKIAPNTFQNHEFTLGLNISDFFQKKDG